MYALVDCNNFYASCERVFQPALNNQPIVILSNNDGCVISRSNEAKELGIPMAAAAFKYEEFFRKNNVKVFSSNYALYADMSNRVMHILSSYCPAIEIYSIDESFLSFDDFQRHDLVTYCRTIKDNLFQYTKIPVCIGIAPTKALAKVANHIAKKFPSHHRGVYFLNDINKITKALKWLPIEDVWGIGRRLTKRLIQLGIHKAYDFIQLSDAYILKNFSIVELRLKNELEGKSVLKLNEITHKKTIATTRTFEKATKDYHYIRERISTFAVSCAEKLRKQSSHCQIVTIVLQTSRFDRNGLSNNKIQSRQLIVDSNSSITINKAAISILDSIFTEGICYKRAGVIVSAITSAKQLQLNLFEDKHLQHIPLMQVMDELNCRYGASTIKLASQALDRTWLMKQEHLSPAYTTSYNHILKVW